MVNKLIKLNAVLRLYHQNFLNLHWNSAGEEFNDAHKGISTDYYELCDKYIDTTAEMICRRILKKYLKMMKLKIAAILELNLILKLCIVNLIFSIDILTREE